MKINIDKKNKKDYYNKERHSYTKINENIINEQHEDECKEILSILEKPIRKNIYDTPFKPLKNPKKVSLEGKVLFNSSFWNIDGEICWIEINRIVILFYER